MRVQFSGIYKILPVLSDQRHSMVDAESVQALVQTVIDQTYLGTRPRATSFVVDGEVVMVANDRKGKDYDRFLTRQAEEMGTLSEPLRRFFAKPGFEDPRPTSATGQENEKARTTVATEDGQGYMPVNRIPFMIPGPKESTRLVQELLLGIHREFLAEASPVGLFVRVAKRRAAEVFIEHPASTSDEGETWNFKTQPKSRGLLSIFG